MFPNNVCKTNALSTKLLPLCGLGSGGGAPGKKATLMGQDKQKPKPKPMSIQ